MGRGALILLVLAGPAAAQDLPAVYAVAGVASDDRLNIRAEPSADAPVIGSYAPDRTRIEVLALSPAGNWGLVGQPEGNGWVAMRFLVAEATDETALPHPFRCVGTEPFWGVDVDGGMASFSTPEGREPLTLVSQGTAANGVFAALTGPGGSDWAMIAVHGQCSDGMSDRIYGWQTMVWRGNDTVLSGCCTMDGG